MRTTFKAVVGMFLAATALGAMTSAAFAEGDAKDGQWLNSRCKSARLAFAVEQQYLTGHVKVKFDIAANGRVTNIRIIESEPAGVMDRSVKNAVRGWRYFAYMQDGVEAERKDVALTFTFGGPAADREASCIHMPWSDATTASLK